MTREEFEIYKAELMERFYWCPTIGEKNFLTKEKGYRFLFRCTHYKTNKYFWVFDKSDELMKDIDEWKSTHKKEKKEVSKSIATNE